MERLIFPENYWRRAREVWAGGSPWELAWEVVESELYAETGVCRFTQYNSFQKAKALENARRTSPIITLSREVPRQIRERAESKTPDS